MFLPQLAGILGSIFTVSAIPTWYAELIKPSFSPPNWLFGPTWIFLYFLMGISIYLIWSAFDNQELKSKAKKAFNLFWIHLFFNAIWSIIFFGLQNPGLAFLNIIIIWLLILALMFKFWRINQLASYLLIPYFVWVSFASILNYAIWQLN